MLHLIGLGLADHNDLSLKSLKILKNADKIYLEAYTCIIHNTLSELEVFLEKKINLADRTLLENTNILINESKTKNICLLIPGTPLFATTHTDLILRCKKENIKCSIINNTSIFNVMGHLGLYSYNFGRTISIPFFTESFKPFSLYDKIKINFENNLHTLCLLDIKINSDYYNQEIKNNDFNKVKQFMSANEALKILLDCESERKFKILNKNTKLFVICRFGHETEQFFYDSIENLIKKDFGKPLHSLVIPGKLEEIEKEHIFELFSNK